MKKTLLTIMGVGLAFSLFGCGNSKGEKVDRIEYESVDPVIMIKGLKDEKGFYAEYDVNYVTNNKKQHFAFGASNNYYYTDENGKVTYTDLSDSNKSVTYKKDSSGTWVYTETNIGPDFTSKNAIDSVFDNTTITIMESAKDASIYSSTEIYLSQKTFLKRDCDKYTVKTKVNASDGVNGVKTPSEVTETLYFDKKTGLCLYSEYKAKRNGQVVNHTIFTCTNFLTSYEINLPNA